MKARCFASDSFVYIC